MQEASATIAANPAGDASGEGSSFAKSVPQSRKDDGSRLVVGTPEFERLSRSMDRRPTGYKVAKRAFDIVFSLVVVAVCVALLPLTLAVLVATSASTKGSPIYLQTRVGRYGRPFRILKLRTMVADSDDVEKYLSPEQMEQWKRERKVGDDPRITRFGGFLRKTSLDEIPQFLNVLAGQMSIIGPRAISKDELGWYSASEQAELLAVPQGITGWWQAGARNNASFESGERQHIELSYVQEASIAADAKCFFATFNTIFRKRSGR